MQQEHKHAHPEGETRKIIDNMLHNEENRRQENLKKGPTTVRDEKKE